MSYVEAVATIVLFILMPVIVVWSQIRLVQVIENIGAGNRGKQGLGNLRWVENSEAEVLTLSRSSIARTAAERSIPNWHNTQFWHGREAVAVLWGATWL
jgi:hypothetical protein